MKRFLLIFIPVLAVVAVLMFAPSRLGEALGVNSGSENKKRDLGFMCELVDSPEHKFYEEDGQTVGECVWLNLGQSSLDKVCSKLGMTITNRYVVGENYIIEGVAPRLSYHIPGRQANVQIAVSDGGMTIGSPIIYGSY